MRTLSNRLIAMVIAFTTTFTLVLANVPPTGDYTIHTLYIFNFTKYVEWPTGPKSIKIGVVDNAAAEESLQKMAKVKSTAAFEITVINTKSESELATCQIIFIPTNSMNLAPKLIETFNTKPILICTEDPDFTQKGASVSFKVVANKLRFQINEEVIKRKGMKVATALVSLSEK